MSRDLRMREGSSIAATKASAVNWPTPGIVISRRQAAEALVRRLMSAGFAEQACHPAGDLVFVDRSANSDAIRPGIPHPEEVPALDQLENTVRRSDAFATSGNGRLPRVSASDDRNPPTALGGILPLRSDRRSTRTSRDLLSFTSTLASRRARQPRIRHYLLAIWTDLYFVITYKLPANQEDLCATMKPRPRMNIFLSACFTSCCANFDANASK